MYVRDHIHTAITLFQEREENGDGIIVKIKKVKKKNKIVKRELERLRKITDTVFWIPSPDTRFAKYSSQLVLNPN